MFSLLSNLILFWVERIETPILLFQFLQQQSDEFRIHREYILKQIVAENFVAFTKKLSPESSTS